MPAGSIGRVRVATGAVGRGPLPLAAAGHLGRHHAAGDHQLDALLDRHVEEDHILARQEQQVAGGRVGRGRQEDVDHLVLDHVLNFALGRAGGEADRPAALARVGDQDDVAERPRALMEHRLEDLLQGGVDRADDRHAVEHVLAVAHDCATDQACRQPAHDGQRQDDDEHANARHGERQVALRVVAVRQHGKNLLVDHIDDQRDQVERQADRRHDDDPRDEIVAQARPEAALGPVELIVVRGHPRPLRAAPATGVQYVGRV